MTRREMQERYCEDYRRMDYEARWRPAPMHGSPDIDMEDGDDCYDIDAWECANLFECSYDRDEGGES